MSPHQAHVVDKQVLDDLQTALKQFSHETEEALRLIGNELRRDEQFINGRVRDWQRIVDVCYRHYVTESQNRDNRRAPDRSACRAFIQCQRFGARANKGYGGLKSSFLDEAAISRLSANGLLELARARLAQAKKAQTDMRAAVVAYQKIAAETNALTRLHTPKSVAILSRHRRQLDAYGSFTLTGLLTSAIANYFGGGAVSTASADADAIETEASTADAPASGLLTGIYRRLIQAEATPDPKSGITTSTAHPELEFTLQGDAFGPYAQLRAFLQAEGLSAPRGGDQVGVEAHHLLEGRLMDHFGFTRDEGLAVAIYADDHMQAVHGEAGVDFQLPRGDAGETLAYDIWDVVEGHIQAYEEIGRPEWAARVRRYVLANRERILAAYKNGAVSWATPEDAARAEQFLASLE